MDVGMFRGKPFWVHVWKVLDGDSLLVYPSDCPDPGFEVRLAGLDAPESRQPGGVETVEYLRRRSLGEDFAFGETARSWGRVYGVLYQPRLYDIDVENVLNSFLLEAGWAWSYNRYVSIPEFRDAEQSARAAGHGIWSPDMPEPIPPWEWRQGRRK